MELPHQLESVFKYNQLKQFCLKYHIINLSVYGSILTENYTPSSDIDLLVEFDPDYIPGLFDIVEMERKLSIIFKKRKIDLRTKQDLSRYFRNDVLKKAILLYGKR